MRAFKFGLLLVAVAGVMCGCGSMCAKSGAPATTNAATTAGAKAWIMQSGGADVLKLTAQSDVKCVSAEGSLHFTAPQYEVEFWLVPGAHSVDDAVGQIGPVITDQFKDFKPDQTTDLTVGGSPAKQLVGPGHEADDGDPGDADVIVFKVGDHIFIACNHGESLTPAGQEGLLSLAQTAQVP